MQKYIIFVSLFLSLTIGAFANNQHKSTIVTDKRNMIYWQDNISSKESSEDWEDAVLYCANMKIDDITSWRLPTFDELLSIVDYSRSYPAINPIFEETSDSTYWTSTFFSPSKARAWTINFSIGKTYYNYKTTNHTVRCVKDIDVSNKKER